MTAPVAARRGTNSHVHTNHSFSVFTSPAAAAEAAAAAGLEAVGINDFFTVSGFAEFRTACTRLALPALYCCECISMDAAAEAAGELYNDPANPGRIYLSAKGIARPDDVAGNAVLAEIRRHQDTRNRALVERVAAHFQKTAGHTGPTWAEVVEQTPHGNTTERHVAKAILATIQRSASGTAFAESYARIIGEPPKSDPAQQQIQIRNCLLKAGKPCYVPEDRAAFPSVERLRDAFLALGAIPTYPVLGNPLTAGEKDISRLFDRLDGWGFRAIELISNRNTDDRVAAVVAECARRGWPVCDGTEHNTPAMEPMLTKWVLDPRFAQAFRDGMAVNLGHQELVGSGQPGYVNASGAIVPGSLAACRSLGQRLCERFAAGAMAR
jgi:hypothetical protein